MYKVTFDSNVWENLVEPNPRLTVSEVEVYRRIVQAIEQRNILPFLSAAIFNLEAIRRNNRKSFIKVHNDSFKLKVAVLEDLPDGTGRFTTRFETNRNLHPGNHQVLKDRLAKALAIGFQIVNFPRIAGLFNPEIGDKLYNNSFTPEQQNAFNEKSGLVAERIRQMKAGEYDLRQIGVRYDFQSWFVGVGKAPDTENENIAVAIAEFADGDAVSGHVGIGGDYFCTNDQGRSAGHNSVLFPRNVAILEEEFGFKKASPAELVSLCCR